MRYVKRVKALIGVRQSFPVVRIGRQYARKTRNFGTAFASAAAGEIFAWSRILDEEEAVCVINGHGTQNRGADVTVDATLNGAAGTALEVVGNSAQAAAGAGYAGP